jgi:hypothetical protein
MRRLALLTLLSLSILPGVALAQDAPNPPPPGPPGMDMPPQPPGGPDGWTQHGDWKHHGDWMRGPDGGDMLMKFYAANTTHDGHLTLAQAKSAGLQPIVDHFSEIDTKNRGYITFYDIQAWHLDGMAKHLEAAADKLRAQD